jgi:hypothetical protein
MMQEVENKMWKDQLYNCYLEPVLLLWASDVTYVCLTFLLEPGTSH